MKITDAMLDAALRKATEAGLFSRRCTPGDIVLNREIMHCVLQAALEAKDRPFERWLLARDTPARRARARSQ